METNKSEIAEDVHGLGYVWWKKHEKKLAKQSEAVGLAMLPRMSFP